MIIELGHFALIVVLCLALLQSFFGIAGAHLRKPHWMAITSRTVAGQFVCTALSFGCLAYSFLAKDFSVLYVASNSSSALPAFYRFAAVWGAHEGSLLLWMLVLSSWTLAVAALSRSVPEAMLSRVLGVLGVLTAGFALFVLWKSSPFERLWPAPAEGRDLNALLQDPGQILHPPLLYTGYVGLSVPFAFAIAALLEGKVDATWARLVRPWTTGAWIFLTLGIGMGSWWAYYELGWGGWWFWDAVENASFMPWLVATALIHSLAVTEKRGLFKSWTVLLTITAFSLTMIGTFMVRSGVIESVHAFASDPERGLYILIFLSVCIISALTLYAWRLPLLKSDAGFSIVSRESFLMFNNVLLVAATGFIFIGTLYPVFLDALSLEKISVGPPYFNVAFLIPMLPLVFLMGVGMHAAWKKAAFERVRTTLFAAFVGAIFLAVIFSLATYGWNSVMTTVGLIAAFWVILTSLIEPIDRMRNGHSLSAGVVGMCVAHLGLGAFVLGATTVESYEIEKDLSLRPGTTVSVGDYTFTMNSIREVPGPNFTAEESEVVIRRDGEEVAIVHPQKRVYHLQESSMTEAGISSGWTRDLFVAMGSPLGDGAWSMRIQYKPYVRFIWVGVIVMALGGLIAVCDRRYRRVRVTSNVPVAAGTKTA